MTKKPDQASVNELLNKIKGMIEKDFPPMKVKGITGYSFQGKDLVGAFVSDQDRAYSFFIEADDPRTMIQPL